MYLIIRRSGLNRILYCYLSNTDLFKLDKEYIRIYSLEHRENVTAYFGFFKSQIIFCKKIK